LNCKSKLNFGLRAIYIILMAVIFHSTANSQITTSSKEYSATIRQFTSKNGLSHNAINWVYQDSRNLYWITTHHGLNRFDGHQFKLYTKERNNLHSNILDVVYEDINRDTSATREEKGMIWVFTGRSKSDQWFIEKGEFRYSIFNPYTEQTITPEDYLDTELYEHLKDLETYQVKKDHLLLLTNTGYVIKYYDRDKVEIIKIRESIDLFFHYKKLSNERYWVGWREGLYHNLQLSTKDHQPIKTIKFCAVGHSCDYREECLGDIHITPSNNTSDSIWFSSIAGTSELNSIFCLTPTGEILSVPYHTLIPGLSKSKQLFITFYDANEKLFWLTDGVKKTYVVHLEKKLVLTLDFPCHRIWLKDTQNHIWSSNNNGLFVIQMGKGRFQRYAQGLSVRGLVVDNKKQVWAYPNYIEGKSSMKDQRHFTNDAILSGLGLLKDADHTIWSFCVLDDQLWLGNFTDKKDGLANLAPLNIPARSVWSIYKDDNTGLFWGGGEGDFLVNYQPNTKKTTLVESFNGFDAFKESTVYQNKPHGENHFWLATSTGLYLLHWQDGIQARYWNEGEYQFPRDSTFCEFV